jgi:transcriptional regulator with XRE-family HTH domain
MTSISSHSSQSNVGNALKIARKAKKVPQEGFDQISSRTYVSALERGIKQPTITKVDALASVLEVHPLTLLTLAYLERPTATAARKLLTQVTKEIDELKLGR